MPRRTNTDVHRGIVVDIQTTQISFSISKWPKLIKCFFFTTYSYCHLNYEVLIQTFSFLLFGDDFSKMYVVAAERGRAKCRRKKGVKNFPKIDSDKNLL